MNRVSGNAMKLFSVLVVSVGLCRLASGTTLTEMKSLPPFGAVLLGYQLREDAAHHVGLEIKLRQADGADFVITEPQASLFQIAFATSLKPGQTNSFPQVLLDFKTARANRPSPPRRFSRSRSNF